jgi:hypothetical protein
VHDARAADVSGFDQYHALAEIKGPHGRGESARSRSNHAYVEFVGFHGCSETFPQAYLFRGPNASFVGVPGAASGKAPMLLFSVRQTGRRKTRVSGKHDHPNDKEAP